jgi:hypothetical protein
MVENSFISLINFLGSHFPEKEIRKLGIASSQQIKQVPCGDNTTNNVPYNDSTTVPTVIARSDLRSDEAILPCEE